MTTTRKGYAVQEPDSKQLATFTRAGVPFKVWAPAAPAFEWLTTFLHAIEPVTEYGWDGGYAYRKIGGTNVWSEHAAGVAIDWNAAQHPLGTPKSTGWNKAQVGGIEWLLSKTLKGSFFEWGGHWKRPDPMHFELKNVDKWQADNNPWTTR